MKILREPLVHFLVLAMLLLAWLLRGLRLDIQDRVRVVPAYVTGTLATYWFLRHAAMIFPIAWPMNAVPGQSHYSYRFVC